MKKNPRIAIYYSNKFGRNDGSPLYYLNAMKDMGLDVTHLLPEGDTSRFGKFDLHFWVDWGEDGLSWEKWDIPQDGGKTIYVASDTHLGRDYRFEMAKKFDYVWFNQLRAVQEYQESFPAGRTPKNIGWLPHAFEPKAYPTFDIIKKWDIGFIGHVQEEKNYNGFSRVEALDRLFKEFPNFYYGSRHPAFPGKNVFEDAAKKFAQCRIVFNISIKDDINMRVFETLGTKSLLLTNNIPTISELFEHGKHLVLYNTLDEMLEFAHYYLEHEEEADVIAQTGYDEVISHHTYQKRIETILTDIGYKIENKSVQ